MNNQTISQLANKIIALRSAAQPAQAIPQALTYKSGGHTGAMIALFVPPDVGGHFVQSDPGALPPGELHITLAYLGEADDLSDRQILETRDMMRLISENHPPLTGHINGCGRFCNGDDDGDPFFIIPDLAALPNLRQIIIDCLNGLDIEAAKDHGFVPHITLTYLPHAEYNPFDIIEKTPITFGAISLVLGGDRYDYPLAQGVPLNHKALIEKIGARHTGAECGTIQKMHDLTLELGAECHPLTRRAGARHSHADQGMVQRMHDDCVGLGAECKALPERDKVYGSQTLKERRADPELLARIREQCGLSQNGKIIKAQSDAPNYAPASTPQRCANCRFFLGDPGRDWCERFNFTADPDYVSDAWEAQRHDEIPGYVANKSDLAALTEGVLILRGGRSSGNWGHAGRKGKRGGSGGGGGFKRIGVKPGSKPSRKKVQAAAKKKQAQVRASKPAAKPKVQTKQKATSTTKKPISQMSQKELQKLNKKLLGESASGKAAKKPAAKKTAKPKPDPAAEKPAAKKRAAKEDRVPKVDKTATGDVADAKATNDKVMSKNSEAWQKNMSAAELGGLQAYQGSQFQSINGGLRGSEKSTAASKKDIRNIDKALAKSPLKEDTVVFRSMDENTLEKLLGPDKKKWTGQGYSDKGYTSTSIDPGGTSGFRGIPMEIRVPKGTPSGYLANLPGGGVISAGEKELLLGRGQKFRILKVKGGRRPKIIAEVVNE